jgi:membrane protease subunit HflC
MTANPRVISLMTLVGVLLIAGVVLLSASTYALDETEQAVVVQFGKPVGETVFASGLHFKLPFVQEVRRFDKRLLAWDGAPNQIPTRGREFISVDTTARWKIVDPLLFLKSVRDESGAQSRLDDIIDSVVRDNISSTELVEIVRSADWEVSADDLLDDDGGELTEPGLADRIQMGRLKLTRQILREGQKQMPQYGIELADVRIKRLNYIPSVQQQVFRRMISERERIAEQFRSEGQGEASRIQGQTSQELAEIRSEAMRKAEVIRGEADAEATKIYNEAFSVDPEFYAFSRTLDSYAKSLGPDTVLVIGTDSEYFRHLVQRRSPEP